MSPEPYPTLTFPTLPDRPYFYTNFVSSVDGKVQVRKKDWKAYWPIGSSIDYQTLIMLRTYADSLIHGKSTALDFHTVRSLIKPEFRKARADIGKPELLPYIIVGHDFDANTIPFLANDAGLKPIIVTTSSSNIASEVERLSTVIRFDDERVNISTLSTWLYTQDYRVALIEGGPTLIGEFLSTGLLDEIFLTLAPKIFGNASGETLTMVEGHLFAPDAFPHLQLVSVQPVKDEVYLRYKIKNPKH